MTKLASVLVLALALSGCAGGLGGIFGPTEDYTASVCAEGVVAIPCRDVGTIPVPEGGQGLVSLVVAIAGPLLAREGNLKGCVYTTFPETVGRAIKVTATATCTFRGVPAQEIVTVTLTPVLVVAAAG